MTDYQKVTGKTGLMMIRDLGWTVEFWFKAGYASDWANALDFNWTANGTTTAKAIKYPTGAQWAKVGSVNIGSSQTITFRLLDATGTQGMGGPTTFNQWIERAQRPNPPGTPSLSNVGSSSITVTVDTSSWDGGAPIDARQIGYGTDPWTAQFFADTWTSTNIGGLLSGTTFYFWSRSHNYQGWSDWSGRAQATTLRIPDSTTTPIISNISATTATVTFSPNGNGGSTILEYQVGYGTDPLTVQTVVSAVSPKLITGLLPGTTYRFWARARNAVGWGPWSNPAIAKTIAGAYIKVDTSPAGGLWKLAVPYVKVGGVWKIAEPWVKTAGVWKKTI